MNQGDWIVISIVFAVLLAVAVTHIRDEREFRRLCERWDREIGEELRRRGVKPRLRVVEGGRATGGGGRR